MRIVYGAILLVLCLTACSMHAGETSYPGGLPVAATAELVEPTTAATRPPTEPTTRATEPETEELEPETEATEPPTEATEAETEATEPTVAATEPEPTEPTTESVVVTVGDLARDVILFRVVDTSGAPVAGLTGTLEIQADGIAFARPLTGDGGALMSGGNGCLYATGMQSSEAGLKYRLLLSSYYGGDLSLTLAETEPLPRSPAEVTVTWTKELPPSSLPAQTAGMRIFMIDAGGAPVPGVTLTGSPYPLETVGPVNSIAITLGPSDADGAIRWDDVKPGTYELTATKDGASTRFTFVMPEGQALVELWAVLG